MLLLLLCILGASAQPMLPAGEADPSRMQSPALTGIVPAAARTTDATAPGLAPRPGMAALASGLMGLGPGAGPIDPTETLHRTQELLSENAAAREALSAAAAEVAAHPGQQRALATLMGLMNQPAGARTVIDSVTELLRGERHGPALTSLASGLGLPLDALAEYNARAPAPQRAPAAALDSVEEAHVPEGLAPAPAVID